MLVLEDKNETQNSCSGCDDCRTEMVVQGTHLRSRICFLVPLTWTFILGRTHLSFQGLNETKFRVPSDEMVCPEIVVSRDANSSCLKKRDAGRLLNKLENFALRKI